MKDSQPQKSWLPGAKSTSIAAFVLFSAVLYVTLWWPFQQRAALIRDIGALGGQVNVEQRGPSWLRSLTGYGPQHGVSVYPVFGIMDRVVKVEFVIGGPKIERPSAH